MEAMAKLGKQFETMRLMDEIRVLKEERDGVAKCALGYRNEISQLTADNVKLAEKVAEHAETIGSHQADGMLTIKSFSEILEKIFKKLHHSQHVDHPDV